jgi:ribosomal protein S12 methylthiotransferase accessory factor YcaO
VFPESDDPVRWRYARSNGVALHANWRAACTRARWELAERDRVLRAWYGEIRPARLPFPPASSPLRETRSYEWSAYAFPEPDPTSFSVGVEVVGVFGFPITPLAPLVMGFAARADAPGALDAATTEAMQLLAFLWGEALPESPPALGPTAAQHLDHFQWHGRHPALRRWLDGAHTEHASRAGRTNAVASEVAFLDLTPDWLGGGLRVAKAICPAAMPLIFGDSPFGRHLPQELRAHPIA